ncbi:helix-turn-helix domain-containing protein [Deinococcus marmoris]|uniref:Transcriptional regulator, HTH_3 family n=1 Tax=Deinococcus marmoris TaxID=249408 RepID=A0A1U7P4W2_9DEIO|nr:helix-turn-helix transcriptional regulator [Deinococcus marmoris]OLV20196.1 transcriptional regulator, HTH_3 family [Deinococcus marmoris]
MTLAQRLRELRQARGLRLRDVGDVTGHTVPYLSDLERGRTPRGLDSLRALAHVYGLSVSELLTGVDWAGQLTGAGRPLGLQALLDDPVFGPQVTPEWTELLARIEYRGRRPRGVAEYLIIFLHLRRVLGV